MAVCLSDGSCAIGFDMGMKAELRLEERLSEAASTHWLVLV